MADSKISALPAATLPLAGTEVLPIVQGGTTDKVAVNDLTVRNLRANATTGILQVTGPTAGATRVATVPDANWTAARTDAAQSFTGDQTFGTVLATTFDTNVTAAKVALSGTTITASGTDSSVNVNVIPKGSGVFAVPINISTAWSPVGSVPKIVITNSSATTNSTALYSALVVGTDGASGGVKFGAVAVNNYGADFVIATRSIADYAEVFKASSLGNVTVSTGNLVIGTAGKGVSLPGSITWTSGSGSPEGVVTAPVGSLYSRSDGGLLTSLYVKESGSGNTGWMGK